MEGTMIDSAVQNTPGLAFRSARRPAALGLARPPSFARALRQRGLIAPGSLGPDFLAVEAEQGESWSPALSLYEAHLRRRAMEQVFAVLRGDVS